MTYRFCPSCGVKIPYMEDYDPSCAGCIGISNIHGVHTCKKYEGLPNGTFHFCSCNTVDRIAELREKYGSGVGCDDHADVIMRETCQLIDHVDDAGAVINKLLDEIKRLKRE